MDEKLNTHLSELPFACTPTATVPGHEASLLPNGRKFHLVWNDEFDGDSLDSSKWGFRTHFWGKRFPCFADENDTDALEIKDSCIYLYLREKDGRFYSPQLQTGALLYDGPMKAPEEKSLWPYVKRLPPRFMHKYGFYECRARTQAKPNWWSAFWLQSPDVGSTLDPRRSGIECDIMESFTPGYVQPSNMHYNGYAEEHKGFNSSRKPYSPEEDDYFLSTDEFHTFSCLWEPDGYTFFIDGHQKGYKIGCGGGNEAVSDAEQFILISTEAMSFRKDGKPKEGLKNSIGDAFIVDYVRVYDYEA